VIFNDAANLNMTGAGYVWIVTEQALNAPNAPDGLLGLKLINATQEKSHITDSLSVHVLTANIFTVRFSFYRVAHLSLSKILF